MEELKPICEKEKYDTLQDVIRAMDGLAKRGVTKLRNYHCDQCNKYHITSIKPGTKKTGNKGNDKRYSVKMENFKKQHPNTFRKIKVTKEEIERGRRQQNQKPITDLSIKLQSFINKNK